MATKSLVMVLLIGVVCANVSARPLEKVSKELTGEKIALGEVLTPLLRGVLETVTGILGMVAQPSSSMTGDTDTATTIITNEGSEVSKEAKPSLSVPAATTGIGAQLAVVNSDTNAYGSGYSSSNAAAGPGGPSGDTYASGYGSTSGSVRAEGPRADAYSSSGAYGQGSTDAAVGPSGATANGNGSGSGSTVAYGNAGP